MKKMIEKYLYVLVMVTCIFILVGCAGKPKPPKTLDPIANAKELGVALGCVFAPNTCKSKEEIKKEQDEITKDFDKIDAELAKEAQKQ
jgi:hypothetical protein